MPLEIRIPDREIWDEKNEIFIQIQGRVIHLEHSLKAIAKWEGKWKKPFLTDQGLKDEMFLDYVRCMTLEDDVDPSCYLGILQKDVSRIRSYMDDSMTATWFKEDKEPKKGKSKMPSKVITAEIIYYYMVDLGIPFECENWHINRLMTLVRVCAEKNQPPKKMAKNDVLSQYAALNKARRAKLGTKG